MTARDFSFGARQSTRVLLRLPMLLVLKQQNGYSRTLNAWSLVVNKYGARIECARPLDLHQEVLVTIPTTGLSARGKVVWLDDKPNKSGHFEFGVELRQEKNLWGISFPSNDNAAGNASVSSGEAIEINLSGASSFSREARFPW